MHRVILQWKMWSIDVWHEKEVKHLASGWEISTESYFSLCGWHNWFGGRLRVKLPKKGHRLGTLDLLVGEICD